MMKIVNKNSMESGEVDNYQYDRIPWKTPGVEDTIVGVDDDILEIKTRLCSSLSKLEVVAIVGMGGIGKTAVARKVYEDQLVMHHFYVRAWVTVSRHHRLREMLLGLLRCVVRSSDEIQERTDQQLAEELRRNLIGKRYLIVMDDVWSTEAWDDVKTSFPDGWNGSRIVLTSRIMAVAVHAQPGSSPHCLRPLDLQQSWELLCHKVFVKMPSPPDLAEIGKKIAEKCQGLPLAIVVVAGSLSKVRHTRTSWLDFEKIVGSVATQHMERCLDILALSYHNLPCHLKPCFLYMGAFPEDYEIHAWILIRLWVAEGFLPETQLKSPEEVAENCLEDLISRSLVMVVKRRSDGGVKTCLIHDLLRDLSLKEGEKEEFFQVKKEHDSIYSAHAYNAQRLSFISGVDIIGTKLDTISLKQSSPLTRSFLSFATISTLQSETIFPISSFRLLRVLHSVGHTFPNFPDEVTELIHLKYLALNFYHPNFPLSVSRLVNLQTLVLETSQSLSIPEEVWQMEQLRHLHFKNSSSWPNPISSKVFSNLQTLSLIDLYSCPGEVFISMSSLKKLGIAGCWPEVENFELHKRRTRLQLFNCLSNISNLIYLKRLEKLKLYKILEKDIPRWDVFPQNLKKLSITMCYVSLKSVTTFSMLPNLEILKLQDVCFDRAGLVLTKQVFKSLKFLQIQSSSLEHWKVAGSCHFPKLEHIVLKHCFSLNEIPDEIGDISTLKLIELHHSPAIEQCARKIQDEQSDLGNDSFKVYINHSVNA